jgi:cytochrome o ubiquinol oxidase operon protein cyoD
MNEQTREATTQIAGYVLAAVLTATAFIAVVSGRLSSEAALITVGVAGIVQLLVHLRCFLHIDLSRQKREDLQLILFSALLLTIMIGGTVWIMGNLAEHMQ